MRATLAAYLLSSLVALEVHAQPSSPRSEEQKKKAAQLADEARASYNLLEYQAALDAYKAAYALSRDPAMLLHIGQCYEQLGDPERAVISAQTYLDLAPEGALRKDAEALLNRIQKPISLTNEPSSTILLTEKPAPSKNPAVFLYGGAAAGASLGMLCGAIAITARLEAAQLAVEGSSPEDFSRFSLRSKRAGLATDLLFISGITSGVVGHMIRPSPHANKIVFGIAGGAATLGVTTGLVALFAKQQAEELTDTEEARYQAERATVYSRTADLAFLSAALLGGAGVWLSVKRQAHVQILPASRGVALQIGF